MLYILYTILGCFICAIAQVAGTAATRDLHPVKVCFFRFGLAAPMCYVLSVAMTGDAFPDLTLRQYAMTALVGLISWVVGAIIFFTAMNKGGMHRVAPVSNSIGIWTVLLSVIFLGEKFLPMFIPVIILLGIGVAFMGPAPKNGAHNWRPAIPAALLVSILWAVGIIITKIAVAGVPYATFVFIKLTAAAVALGAMYPFVGGKVTRKTFLICLLSATTLVFGDTLLMAGLDGLPASVWAPLFATTIPFGFVLSIIFLKENPLRRNWLGMIFIFAAAAICGYIAAVG